MTRPDLAWSYSELSKYVQNPGKAHIDAAHHVLANTIWGWVDSDWAADLDSRRSHTGYVIILTSGASGSHVDRIVSHFLPLRLNT